MWRKIKCWLGWHEWVLRDCANCDRVEKCAWGKVIATKCRFKQFTCKHCGKVKK